jgi:para-nitrobenzyl esterase
MQTGIGAITTRLAVLLGVALLLGGCGGDSSSTVTVVWDGTVFPVAVESDVKYGEGETRSGTNADLLMDIYTPEGDARPNRAAMLIVHGGAWAIGDKTNPSQVSLAHFYAERGFVTCVINYRMAGDDPVAAPEWWTNLASLFLDEPTVRASYAGMVDTATAVRFIRANAGALGVDPNHIFAIGSSAGAFNVVHVALDAPDAYLSMLPVNNLDQSSELQLVIDLWGGFFRRWEVDPTDPPVLILHGTLDAIVPFTLSQNLAASLADAGVPHEFNPLEGAGHSAWDAVVDGRTLNDISMDFIAMHGGIAVIPPAAP